MATSAPDRGQPEAPAGAPSRGPWPRRTIAGIAGVLALLVGLVAARSAGIADAADVALSAAVGVAVVAVGRAAGASWSELGLARDRVPAGLKLGGLVFVAVLGVMLLVAALPPTRGFLTDNRVDVSLGEMLLTVLVGTPLGVVVVEELAFRGALLGLFSTHTTKWRAAWMSSVLFGLWHVGPTLGTASGNSTTAGLADHPLGLLALVVGMVLAMTVAGLVLCWLRLRSGSVLAPMLTHVATNSVTFAVAWFVSRGA